MQNNELLKLYEARRRWVNRLSEVCITLAVIMALLCFVAVSARAEKLCVKNELFIDHAILCSTVRERMKYLEKWSRARIINFRVVPEWNPTHAEFIQTLGQVIGAYRGACGI